MTFPLRLFPILSVSLCSLLFQTFPATAQDAPSASEEKTGKPLNVLFILVDDLGWTDLRAFGSTFYDTPHLDALADSGMKFTQAYAACPVCSPTRSSILTGQYPARTKNTDYFGGPNPSDPDMPAKKRERMMRYPLLPAEYSERLDAAHTTLAEALKAQGYATFFAGKWHLGPEGSWPEDHGFDINKGGIDRGGPYGGKKYFSPYGNPRLEDGPEGEHLPHRLASETVKFISDHKDGPFLAYLSFYSVHTPLMGRPDLVEKYQARSEALATPDIKRFGSEPPREVRLVQEHPVYAAMVEAMDAAAGQVLQALEDNGLADNTLVMFFSDNGGLSTSEGSPTSNLPLRAGKGWLYEGGIREPFIVRWPGVTTAGAVCETPVISTDFYPTILDACGLPALPEQTKDGISFTALLKDPKATLPKRDLYWHYPHWGNQGGTPGGAIREGDFKLIESYYGNRVELYDLANDLSERRDLSREYPTKVDYLREKLATWRNETRAVMPTKNPMFKDDFLKW